MPLTCYVERESFHRGVLLFAASRYPARIYDGFFDRDCDTGLAWLRFVSVAISGVEWLAASLIPCCGYLQIYIYSKPLEA